MKISDESAKYNINYYSNEALHKICNRNASQGLSFINIDITIRLCKPILDTIHEVTL